MTPAERILWDAYGYHCPTCLDFGHLGELGPCPHCCPDAYAEHIAAWLDSALGVVA